MITVIYTFEIIAIFVAFLSSAIALRLIYVTRGGLASKAIGHITRGVISLLLAFLTIFIGIAANQLNAFGSSIFLLITSIFLVIGFASICWGEWILFKELS
jgi:hypothetical protein